MTGSNFIFTFDQSAALETAGGKGLNLMRLTQAGMPVPPGFVISTMVYEAFTKSNHLDGRLSAAFSALEQSQPLAEISAQIRAAFAGGEFPPELAEQIVVAYREIGKNAGRTDLPVAVRSSATAEDLAEASFAGQQDTYLNVSGEEELLDAVRRCFGSLWSERAIAYRSRQGIHPEAVALAVVVQQMVPAESAGVMFTANPVTGSRDEIVINASWGLGEAIVSGLVVPDNIVVNKRTGKPKLLAIADKSIMTAVTEDGTQEQAVPAEKRKRRTLSDAQTVELAGLGVKIEQYYGAPEDIEWCFADGCFYIVQARPITALPELPLSWEAPGEGKWLHGGGTFEMITEPISPLFETFLLPIFAGVLIQMLDDIGLKGILPTVPYRVVNGHIYLHVDLHLRPWNLAGVVRDFAMHLNSMRDQEAEQTLYCQTVANLSRPSPDTLNAAQLLERMDALGRAGMRYWLQIMKVVQVIYRQERAFADFYNRRLRRANLPEPEIFLRGQKIKPWEAECSMFDLAQLALKLGLAEKLVAAPEELLIEPEDCPEAREWRAALGAHLERFGHQLASFDLSLPTLADDPRPVLTAIQTYLNGKESPSMRQQRMEEERQAAVAAAESKLSPRNRRKFHQVLSAAQQAARVREDSLFDVGLAWTHMHRIALELGRRLAQKGVVAQPGDVFWLLLDEIRAAFWESGQSGDLTLPVAVRQANNRLWNQADPPYLLPSGSQPAFWWKWIFPTPELNRHPDARTLVGLGVSPGRVTAVARVIHSLDDAQHLNAGEILVAHTTTPAWTPLFARAAGLVTDLGGPLAHGSIVAREYGIPAVMGTGSSTQRIGDGEIITVDGTAGRVVLNTPAPGTANRV